MICTAAVTGNSAAIKADWRIEFRVAGTPISNFGSKPGAIFCDLLVLFIPSLILYPFQSYLNFLQHGSKDMSATPILNLGCKPGAVACTLLEHVSAFYSIVSAPSLNILI